MNYVRSPEVRAVIAGEGPLRNALRPSDRVQLCGFISDEELIERYARALAVVYVPFDEDYGYVTLQAFLAAKPVITAKDSGGVLEWVEDGVTGLVTDGSPAEIGAAIDQLAADRDLARRMGEAGRERVRSLSWRPVVERLLGRA